MTVAKSNENASVPGYNEKRFRIHFDAKPFLHLNLAQLPMKYKNVDCQEEYQYDGNGAVGDQYHGNVI